ncbi:MAG: antibiotic biosynthesis monooxygenase [Planctomycetaceae bacterium]|jgi:quinol monooxygenase YgiN|nr:antibiotic biosynthesis monooxygenase [Planctomycetaceae bacterium]MBT6155467.1 antibiotic biosynthesis monooxygenase [Planctomycetaceae bacterium]MBT6483661.1 antibiotic biosynthesis monooxygenase [Planctomycetaceae bacterium]MBT6497084.1 antibiotic biosynthesis monooxygenase [Planctomycetaceae bacterium]
MIHATIILTVKPEFESDVDEIAGLLTKAGQLSRQEPGCVRFDVFHSQSNASVFLLSECWDSQETLDAHREAEAYTTIYVPKVRPRVERVPHVSTLLE